MMESACLTYTSRGYLKQLDNAGLPPSKPTYNGGVERANRTFRQNFYDEPEIQADRIGALRFNLKNAVAKYNTYRPHFALNGKNPMEYIRINQAKAA